MEIRNYETDDLKQLTEIWNEITEAGQAFPGEELYSLEQMAAFLQMQTAVRCVIQNGQVLGFYILHPNQIGRCSHIANASFAVKKEARGHGVGEALVRDCLKTCAKCRFRGLQFNAVVENNHTAVHLYEKIGFTKVGMIPKGFRLKDGSYQNIFIFYHETADVEASIKSEK